MPVCGTTTARVSLAGLMLEQAVSACNQLGVEPEPLCWRGAVLPGPSVSKPQVR